MCGTETCVSASGLWRHVAPRPASASGHRWPGYPAPSERAPPFTPAASLPAGFYLKAANVSFIGGEKLYAACASCEQEFGCLAGAGCDASEHREDCRACPAGQWAASCGAGCRRLALCWLDGWLACCCRALLCCPPPPTNPPASRSPCLPTCLPACRWLPGVPPCQALQAGAGVPHLPGCVGRGLHPVLYRWHLQGLPFRVLSGCRQALPSVRRRRLQRVQPRRLLQGLQGRVLRGGRHWRGEQARRQPACPIAD